MNNEPTRPAAAESSGGSWMDRYMAPSDVPASGIPAPNQPGISLAGLRGFAWRRRYILAGVIAAALLLGLIATLLMKPVYQAAASMRVEPTTQYIIEGQELATTIFNAREASSFIQTLGVVATSRTLALQVVDALHLEKRPDLLGDAEKPAGMTERQWLQTRRNAAASILQSSVSVDAPMDNLIVTLSVKASKPALAAEIANAYVAQIIDDDLRRGVETNAYALKYLDSQIAETQTRLEETERQAIAYARANRIVGESLLSSSPMEALGLDSGATAPTITASKLGSINARHSDARANRISAQQKWQAVAATPALQLPEVQQSASVQAFVAERAKLAAQLSELNTRYGASYPGVREARAQVAALDRQIAQAASDVKAGLRKNLDVALGEERALAAELNRVSNETLDEQDRRVQFNQLNRETQSLRRQLQALMQRYNQVSSAANLKQGSITRLDAAQASSGPVSPNLLKNLLVALVLGGGLAAGLAILIEFFDDRLRSVDEVERKLGLPLLGQTPFVDGESLDEEDRQLVEAYSSIRTSIDFALPKPKHNVLVFTSSQSSEGKTTTAIFLARKNAQLGRKVLLVDADLRKPSIASLFGAARGTRGFVEVLLGECSLESALLGQPQENLDVLPVGAIPPNPVDVLSSQLVAEFVEKYAPRYSMIIFDTAPVMGLADAPLLSRIADGIIFIVEANRANFGQTKSALRRLRDARANILGVVLTKFRALDAGLNYNYQYTYYSYGRNDTK